MGPVFERLGLTVGCVRQGQQPAERRTAYACDITYCSNKEVAFDYLRDRLVLGGKPHPISMRLGAINGEDTSGRLLLRGLQFAIVDEADSVLVDEARTPLILSGMAGESAEIGRGAWRGRGENSGGGGSFKKKKNKSKGQEHRKKSKEIEKMGVLKQNDNSMNEKCG